MYIRLLSALCVTLIASTTALAHGLHQAFGVNGGGDYQSTAPAYYSPVIDPVAQNDSVFEAGSYTIGPDTFNSLQYTAAFAVVDPPNGIAIGSTWGFDIVGPLVFWDPVAGITDPMIGPADVVATVVRSGVAYTVDKDSTFVTGGNLAAGGGYNGNLGFHNSVTVNLPLGSPAGLYAIGFDVRSTGATPYGTSNVFYAIGTNGLSDADFYRGIADLRAIGVPEPSSIVLAALATAALVVCGWRRKRMTRCA